MKDEAWLSQHCGTLGVEYRAVRCDVRLKAALEGICEEEAGRKARHDAIEGYARELGGKSVYAHNRSDQAETVLLRLLRGTGVHGLAAMEYARADGVIRPLLDTPRTMVEEYCRRKGLSPLWDSTNASPDYTRNRLRMELLPLLEREYNPNLKEGLARLASSARQDDDFLQAEARKAMAWTLLEEPEDIRNSAAGEPPVRSVSFDLKKVRGLHPAVFARMIPMAFATIGLLQDIGDVHLSSLRRVIDSGRGGKTVEFPHGYGAVVGGGLLILTEHLTKRG